MGVFTIIFGCLILVGEANRGFGATTAYVNSSNWVNSSEWSTFPSGQSSENFESVAVGASFSSRSFDSLGANPTNRMSIRVTQGGNLLIQTNALGGLLGQGGAGSFMTIPKPDASTVAVEISFTQSVRAVSFYLGDFADGATPLTLLIKDENNLTLWNSSSPGNSFAGESLSGLGASTWGFIGFTNSDGLNRLTLSVSGTSGDNYAIDTIRYNTIPEPSTLSLVVAGLGGGMGMRRRRGAV